MELHARKTFLPQIIPEVLTSAWELQNHLSRLCPSLLMSCRCAQSLGATNPLSWPLRQEKQLRWDQQTSRGKAAPQQREPSLPRMGTLRSSVSTQLHLAQLKPEASQDSPYTSDWLVTKLGITAGMMSCNSARPKAPMHLALTSLTRSALTSLLTPECSSISLLQTEDQPGTKYPTSN